MLRTVVFENEKISVWCDPARSMVIHRIHRFCANESFRRALTAGLEAVRAQKLTKWLSDDRLNGALPPEDEEWAQSIWFPAMKAAGWRHWAMVQPNSVVGQMNVSRFVRKYGGLGIDARLFDDFDQAFAWLEAQGAPDGLPEHASKRGLAVSS